MNVMDTKKNKVEHENKQSLLPVKDLRRKLSITSLVRQANRSWKWQDRYSLSIYGVRRTHSGILVLYLHSRGRNIASVGRDRRTPNVDSDYQGGLHGHRLMPEHVAIMVERARGVYGERTERAYAHAKNLIRGLSDVVSVTETS